MVQPPPTRARRLAATALLSLAAAMPLAACRGDADEATAGPEPLAADAAVGAETRAAANAAAAADADAAGQAPEAARPAGGMVRVPAGPFFYGCLDPVDVACDADERPSGKLTLPAFAIDRTEVTVAAYRGCVAAGKCAAPKPGAGPDCNWGVPGRERHPINCVELADARSYCAWAGKRVPREQEWEKAARGTDGRMFAWGNLPIAEAGRVANIADRSSDLDWKLTTYDDGFAKTAPVGSFPDGASPYGALDMIGNVWEWTDNPYGHLGGTAVRGCSWRSNHTVCRNSNRLWRKPGQTNAYFGFRCAR
jgi:formylglycine-generating enzyme required for sulfatase activity